VAPGLGGAAKRLLRGNRLLRSVRTPMHPERIGSFEWRIPVGTVPGMHVPGVVFATEELMDKAVEDRAVEQVANVATLPGIVQASYAMPDIHWAYGFPIGGVAAADVGEGG